MSKDEELKAEKTQEDSSEEVRKELALELGLPENATREEINQAGVEKLKEMLALNRGLPESATWSDIVGVDIEYLNRIFDIKTDPEEVKTTKKM